MGRVTNRKAFNTLAHLVPGIPFGPCGAGAEPRGGGGRPAVRIGGLLEEAVKRQLFGVAHIWKHRVSTSTRLAEAEQQLTRCHCFAAAHRAIMTVSPRVFVAGLLSGFESGLDNCSISERRRRGRANHPPGALVDHVAL